MDGLVPGRIVYFVFDEQCAAEVNQRRTTGKSIADRMKQAVRLGNGTLDAIYGWPLGAQAHIGNPVAAGDIFPAVVIRVWGNSVGCVNLKVLLDGNDDFWAQSVMHSDIKEPGSWHWIPR